MQNLGLYETSLIEGINCCFTKISVVGHFYCYCCLCPPAGTEDLRSSAVLWQMS